MEGAIKTFQQPGNPQGMLSQEWAASKTIIPSAMDIWGKEPCVLYFTEGYYKAALCRQT